MATVACPGCGLPRTESEVGATPCPLCAASAPRTGRSHPPLAKKTAPDPTAGLPADASELNAPGARFPARAGGSRAPLVAGAFLLGALCGVGGVLAFQAVERPNPAEPETAAKPEAPPPERPPAVAVAPMPHEPAAPPGAVEPDPDLPPEPNLDFRLVQPPPPPGRVTAIDLGRQPELEFAVPFPMKKGEHVVLRGKVKTLRVGALDAGAVLDASGLEAEVVTVTGNIDHRSALKLSAPKGTVHITGKIDNRSFAEIDAPGGEVRFMLSTTPDREGSKIDGGSAVAVTARTAEFKGDITGADTKVRVLLTRDGRLTVASVTGRAAVGYRSLSGGWSPPEVVVGPVAATATFRKLE